MNLIAGALQPCKALVLWHVGLKLHKYSQHSADLLTYHEKFPDKDIQACRAQLGRFGLSDAHQTALINPLSDGSGTGTSTLPCVVRCR